MTRRIVHAVTSGEYSDYRVLAIFETEEGALAANNAGLGDDYQELILFTDGEVPKKTITAWHAHARVGRYQGPPVVHPVEAWDYHDANPTPAQIYTGRPEVTEREYVKGDFVITVRAATRDAALKACSERYGKLLAQEEGL
jgi:hypothetical protein